MLEEFLDPPHERVLVAGSKRRRRPVTTASSGLQRPKSHPHSMKRVFQTSDPLNPARSSDAAQRGAAAVDGCPEHFPLSTTDGVVEGAAGISGHFAPVTLAHHALRAPTPSHCASADAA
ncbi:hypothetical protein GGR04_002945 [Aureimonas pseudogalii]|uniref:Uncharacterized protein n=1 Tax=Aureimonas pseudogalii TaxID=1744844 RepID=A0A7W6H5T9_9HYPH|nr:hypothetical protein [Aureimonas pseudogalii]